MNLILGTAEFNPEGYAGKPCPSTKEIVRILNLAWEAGICRLDTAQDYNNSELLASLAQPFSQIYKCRDKSLHSAFYHYKQDETAFRCCNASIYTFDQAHAVVDNLIVPFNISRTEFNPLNFQNKVVYARSVFERGRLLKMGYTVKDCLSFVKRHGFDGIIVGVCKEKELKEILKAWGI